MVSEASCADIYGFQYSPDWLRAQLYFCEMFFGAADWRKAIRRRNERGLRLVDMEKGRPCMLPLGMHSLGIDGKEEGCAERHDHDRDR